MNHAPCAEAPATVTSLTPTCAWSQMGTAVRGLVPVWEIPRGWEPHKMWTRVPSESVLSHVAQAALT